VVRVHPQILKNERLPDSWSERPSVKTALKDISSFERYLSRDG
jgi:hypothetical protein